MAITIKNNTAKLQALKEKANALPDNEGGGTVVLDPTTAYATDVLVGKNVYIVDSTGTPTKVNGEMPNLGVVTVEVGLDGTGQNTNYGRINGVEATFSDDVTTEISFQETLLNEVKNILNNKMIGDNSVDIIKAFVGEYKMDKIVVPAGTTNINSYAFSGSAFEEIEISKGVTTINNYAISNCTTVKKVILPNTITSMGAYCFFNSIILEEIVFPSNITHLPDRIFSNCFLLKTIKYADSDFEGEGCYLPNVTSVGAQCFVEADGLIYVGFPNLTNLTGGLFFNCNNLETVELSPNTKIIPATCFNACYKLKNLNIWNNLEEIETNGCRVCGFENVHLPKVKKLGAGAFELCGNLKTVKMDVLEEIGSNVFNSCATLETVVITTDTVPLATGNPFPNCPLLTSIYVSDNLVDSYKSATNWSTYADVIKPLSEYVEE